MRLRLSLSLLPLVLGLLFASSASAQFRSVRVQIIDRGQADGILIRTPNEQWVVIDAGANAQQADAMENTWGVDQVELAILSHRHFDHQGGMDDVIQRFTVGTFLGEMRDCPGRASDDKVRAAILTVKHWSAMRECA